MRTKNTNLSTQCHRLDGRRSAKKALVAVTHSIFLIAFHGIQRKQSYVKLGRDYFDKDRPAIVAKRLLKRLERLGFQDLFQQSAIPLET